MPTKICKKCCITKPLSEYLICKKKDRPNPYIRGTCKICTYKQTSIWAKGRGKKIVEKWKRVNRKRLNANALNKYFRRRHWIGKYKQSQGCYICGYSKCSKALDFHHIEPHKKEKHITRMYSYSLKKLILEIRKCRVICATHHRELHSND